MQILPAIDSIFWKSPTSGLVLHHKVQAPIHLPAQAPRIVLQIGFSDPWQWPLNLNLLQLSSLPLAFFCVAHQRLPILVFVSNELVINNVLPFRIPDQRFHLALPFSRCIAKKHFVVPAFVSVSTVYAHIPCGSLARLDFSLPFFVLPRVLLVVKVSAEGHR